MTAANPQRKISPPAYSPPQPVCRNADVIAFDFVRKQRITFDYDENGNVTSVTDNLGRITLTQYDELNRPIRIVGPQYADAALGNIRPVTTFSYDALGNRTQVAARYTTDLTDLNHPRYWLCGDYRA